MCSMMRAVIEIFHKAAPLRYAAERQGPQSYEHAFRPLVKGFADSTMHEGNDMRFSKSTPLAFLMQS